MQTIGETLRKERENKGLSIKDVEAATSIRALYINAIEENNFKIVPGEVYLKGFIRNYANFLDLNGQNMVDLYRQQQTSAATPQVSSENATHSTEVAPATTTANSGKNIKWIIGGLATVAVAGVIWWALGSQQPAPAPQQLPQTTQTPAVPSPPQITPAPIQNVPAKAKPVIVTAKYTDNCWTLVTADNKEVFEGIPKNGETLTWEADKEIIVKVGNAGAVEFMHNGQSVGKLGGKGEVVVRTFTANPQKP